LKRAERVAIPAEVGCCGWAGDKGFTVPELNANGCAIWRRHCPLAAKRAIRTSCTCEIGLAHHWLAVPVDRVPRRLVRAAAYREASLWTIGRRHQLSSNHRFLSPGCWLRGFDTVMRGRRPPALTEGASRL
jgi:hypothetical protein